MTSTEMPLVRGRHSKAGTGASTAVEEFAAPAHPTERSEAIAETIEWPISFVGSNVSQNKVEDWVAADKNSACFENDDVLAGPCATTPATPDVWSSGPLCLMPHGKPTMPMLRGLLRDYPSHLNGLRVPRTKTQRTTPLGQPPANVTRMCNEPLRVPDLDAEDLEHGYAQGAQQALRRRPALCIDRKNGRPMHTGKPGYL